MPTSARGSPFSDLLKYMYLPKNHSLVGENSSADDTVYGEINSYAVVHSYIDFHLCVGSRQVGFRDFRFLRNEFNFSRNIFAKHQLSSENVKLFMKYSCLVTLHETRLADPVKP